MNVRVLVGAAIFCVVLFGCGAGKQKINDLAVNLPVATYIDISNVQNDRVPVTINPGRFTVETVTYRLPRVVQGTYSVSDFGKYVANFKAIDYDGNDMEFTKIDTNSWVIEKAKLLDKITYEVNDTYDIEEKGGIGGEQPFSPSGTNIEPENYVLNLHGFIGYFDILKSNQYKLDVTAPIDFVRSSALQNTASKESEDGKFLTTSYIAPRYFDITDNPMMYGKLDVEEFLVGDIKIVLSVYSPNNIHTAASLKTTIFKMMEAQKAYLGDINTTPRYDIYLYLSDGESNSPKGFGALEHHTSTVVVLPETLEKEALAESMVDVVSHEFFHIVTPLSVHSEDVHYFDYNNPTFSKHLWMYEGVTEYFATLFQVNQGIVSNEDFYNKINGKIEASKNYDDTMSFTIMSENILKDNYKDQYINVYQKGTLIAMCIDILMREASNGNRGILTLMKELSNKYGKNKPFEDDKLISEITAMTYPSVGEFLNTHVVGDLPINYSDFFEKVGLEIGETKIKANYIMMNGRPIVSGDGQKGTIFFTEAALQNSFWAEQGVQANDVIKTINGTDLTLLNANQVLQGVFSWKPGKDIEVILDRNGEEIHIKTTTTQGYTIGEGLIEKENATQAEITLRKAWMKG
ncbi:peptidase M61 [Flavobacteriaceae bacterium MHTCC 0001]